MEEWKQERDGSLLFVKLNRNCSHTGTGGGGVNVKKKKFLGALNLKSILLYRSQNIVGGERRTTFSGSIACP